MATRCCLSAGVLMAAMRRDYNVAMVLRSLGDGKLSAYRWLMGDLKRAGRTAGA